MDTQLLVIGDSHAHFWNGTGDRYGIDRIPGIRSVGIPGALAYNLVEETSTTQSRQLATHVLYSNINEGFTGWVMLSFGTVDCETFVWRNAQVLGLKEAIRLIIERYVKFILQVKALYPKVVVWGPVTTRKSLAHDSAVGTEVERNLAILVFTEMLRDHLIPHGIPVLTMAEDLLDVDGRTRTDLFLSDNSHISQKMMPQALRLVNTALGTNLYQGETPVAYSEQIVTKFESVGYVVECERDCLQFVLSEGAQFVTDVGILPAAFSEIHKICITTTSDRGFEFEEIGCDGSRYGAKERYYLPVHRIARKILIWGEMRRLVESEIEIYVRATQIHRSAGIDRRALLALRDEVIASRDPIASSQHAVPVLTEVVFNAAALA